MKKIILPLFLSTIVSAHTMEDPNKEFNPSNGQREDLPHLKMSASKFIRQFKKILSEGKNWDLLHIKNALLKPFIDKLTLGSKLKSYNPNERHSPTAYLPSGSLLEVFPIIFRKFKPRINYSDATQIMNSTPNLLEEFYDAGINIKWYFALRNFLISDFNELVSQNISPRMQKIINEQIAADFQNIPRAPRPKSPPKPQRIINSQTNPIILDDDEDEAEANEEEQIGETNRRYHPYARQRSRSPNGSLYSPHSQHRRLSRGNDIQRLSPSDATLPGSSFDWQRSSFDLQNPTPPFERSQATTQQRTWWDNMIPPQRQAPYNDEKVRDSMDEAVAHLHSDLPQTTPHQGPWWDSMITSQGQHASHNDGEAEDYRDNPTIHTRSGPLQNTIQQGTWWDSMITPPRQALHNDGEERDSMEEAVAQFRSGSPQHRPQQGTWSSRIIDSHDEANSDDEKAKDD